MMTFICVIILLLFVIKNPAWENLPLMNKIDFVNRTTSAFEWSATIHIKHMTAIEKGLTQQLIDKWSMSIPPVYLGPSF